jgi:hypothetical protein
MAADDVQRAIDISPVESAKIKSAGDKFMAEIRQLGDNLQDLVRKNASDLERIKFDNDHRFAIYWRCYDAAYAALTPEHQRRAEEIAVQVYGPRCLAFPDAAESAGLTEDQRRQIDALNRAVRVRSAERRQAVYRKGFPWPPRDLKRLTTAERSQLANDEARLPSASGETRIRLVADRDRLLAKAATSWKKSMPILASIDRQRPYELARVAAVNRRDRSESDAQMLALLTAKQRRRFVAMQGAPFQIPHSMEGL